MAKVCLSMAILKDFVKKNPHLKASVKDIVGV
jgi:hypothetical protein